MTFLIDIGRVLLDFDFESSLKRLLPAGCEAPVERMSRLLDRKDEFEAGAIPPDDYITWALGVLGSDATPDEFCHVWRQIFTPNLPMWECIHSLAASGNHQLVLFSNTNAIHCPWAFEAFPDFALFDGAVLSFEVGCIKPEPKIYQHAVEAYQLSPGNTIYIDDLPENIASGRRFGFHCWQYDLTNHAAFEKWLATFSI